MVPLAASATTVKPNAPAPVATVAGGSAAMVSSVAVAGVPSPTKPGTNRLATGLPRPVTSS